jgi:hypothetical protein
LNKEYYENYVGKPMAVFVASKKEMAIINISGK